MKRTPTALACSVAGLVAAVAGWVVLRDTGISPEPARPDVEIEIYEALLQSWLGQSDANVLVDERLAPAPTPSDTEISDCLDDVTFRRGARPALDSLRGAAFKRKSIQIVDGATWHADDQELEAAVARGEFDQRDLTRAFAHGLIRFSHIQFDRDGQLALLTFSHECGGLCGSGSTLLMAKRGTVWKVSRRCRKWVA
jgi:hypothetical protein